MSEEARMRIDSHRLMQTTNTRDSGERVDSSRAEIEKHKVRERSRWIRRARIHAGIFAIAFIFTLGIFTLGILIWVRPEELFSFVMVALFSATIFVSCFTWLRMFILHKLLHEYPNKEEDPGVEHHLAKSIAYGFVALVFAMVLADVIIKIAQARVF